MANYILIILLTTSLLSPSWIEGGKHPTESMELSMTCEEFGRTGRFNPYSVLDDVWFVFYHWGKLSTRQFKFYYPTKKEKEYMKAKLENAIIPVNWSSPMVLMKDLTTRISTLLVKKGDRGQFWKYPFQLTNKEDRVTPLDVRLKQTCENRFIGYMNCLHEHVLVLTRITHIPKKVYLREAAATIGYRGRGGVSYLYRGHHWVPIGEEDEEEYWAHPEVHRRKRWALEKYADLHQGIRGQPDNLTDSPLFPDSVTYSRKSP